MIFQCNMVKEDMIERLVQLIILYWNFENKVAELSSPFSSAIEKSQVHWLYESTTW